MKAETGYKLGQPHYSRWTAALLLLVVFLWSHWPIFQDLWAFWQNSPDYSVGQLVPLVLIYLVWADRKALGRLPVRTCWGGLALLVFAQGVRFFGLLYMYGSLERYSLILTLAGIILFFFGPAVTRRMIYMFAFLVLMMPPPRYVHNHVALPLQNLATSGAVFGLEFLGYLVERQGNVLRLSDETTVAVAEACSGLRLLTAFIVVAATLAFIERRPPWQNGILVLSSLPIAILANILRLIVTILLYEHSGSEVADRFFHDYAGWSMMPFAIVVLLGEIWLINRLVTPDVDPHPKKFARRTSH